jgi:predicted N-acetyltransferase YhbS
MHALHILHVASSYSFYLFSILVLIILAVSPKYRGRGVGAMLIQDGLEVVDEKRLPAWVCGGGGATEITLPLYKKVLELQLRGP